MEFLLRNGLIKLVWELTCPLVGKKKICFIFISLFDRNWKVLKYKISSIQRSLKTGDNLTIGKGTLMSLWPEEKWAQQRQVWVALMDTIKNTDNFQILFQSIRYKRGKLKRQATITKNSNLLALLVISSYLMKSYLALFERSVTLKDTELEGGNSYFWVKTISLRRTRGQGLGTQLTLSQATYTWNILRLISYYFFLAAFS